MTKPISSANETSIEIGTTAVSSGTRLMNSPSVTRSVRSFR